MELLPPLLETVHGNLKVFIDTVLSPVKKVFVFSDLFLNFFSIIAFLHCAILISTSSLLSPSNKSLARRSSSHHFFSHPCTFVHHYCKQKTQTKAFSRFLRSFHFINIRKFYSAHFFLILDLLCELFLYLSHFSHQKQFSLLLLYAFHLSSTKFTTAYKLIGFLPKIFTLRFASCLRVHAIPFFAFFC